MIAKPQTAPQGVSTSQFERDLDQAVRSARAARAARLRKTHRVAAGITAVSIVFAFNTRDSIDGLVVFGWVVLISLAVIVLDHLASSSDLKRAVRTTEADLRRRQRDQERYEQEEQDREHRRRRQEQEACRDRIIALNIESVTLFESLAIQLEGAERQLDRAEQEFTNHAFAPFWDAIEEAAGALARFDERVRQITAKSSHYMQLIQKYSEGPAPEYSLPPDSIARLRVGTVLAERMRSVVRNAQRDFQFAMIYEQRKTNQILVAGFTSLAQALDRMTDQVTSSIYDVTEAVRATTAELTAINSQVAHTGDAMKAAHSEILDAFAGQATRHDKAIAILDNIQRGRSPIL